MKDQEKPFLFPSTPILAEKIPFFFFFHQLFFSNKPLETYIIVPVFTLLKTSFHPFAFP